MKTTKQYLVFFSATGNTRNCIRNIAKEINIPTCEYNITKGIKENVVNLTSSDLLIIAVPSYAGRVPSICISSINKFRGENTPAIVLCTYGNRDYDDTLLELKNLVSANGFKVISAAAFVSTHSIFPKVGADRPSEKDETELVAFAQRSLQLLQKVENFTTLPIIQVKGNYPYREPGAIPLKPKGDKKCDECGTCVYLCPTDAISKDNPRKTDKDKCISCGRCIAVCPQHSRAFRGLLYRIASNRFVKKCAIPQPNVVSYVE